MFPSLFLHFSSVADKWSSVLSFTDPSLQQFLLLSTERVIFSFQKILGLQISTCCLSVAGLTAQQLLLY